MNLLKTHEEILERLTEIAIKETKFEERGQFMNVQKMIREELGIIEKLKEAKIVEFTDVNAYELGVGKILIGQRGSGVTSTLIDECIKYDRPLLFKTQRQADLFKGQYPTLDAYCYDSMEDIGGYSAKEVCVELLMYNPNKDLIDKELEKFRHRVASICTVGVSHDNSNNESDKFMHIVNR